MKRGQIEIMAQILAFCLQAKRKTRIMYQINLSFEQLKTYLTVLTSRNLLMHKSNSYVTTDKGYHFLEAFAQLNDALDDHASIAFVEVIRENCAEAGLKGASGDVSKMLALINKIKRR